MEKVRVLLANHPLMLPDAVREMLCEQDAIEIVGDCRGPMRILREAGRTKADAVVMSHADGVEALCSQLLAVYPDLTILTVAPGLGTGYVQQLCASREMLPGLSSQTIVDRLCRASREPCTDGHE